MKKQKTSITILTYWSENSQLMPLNNSSKLSTKLSSLPLSLGTHKGDQEWNPPAFYPFSLLRNPHPRCLLPAAPEAVSRSILFKDFFAIWFFGNPASSFSSDSTSALLLAPFSYTVKFIISWSLLKVINTPSIKPKSLFLVSIPNQCSIPYLKLQVGSVPLPVSPFIYIPISVPPFYWHKKI